MSKKTNTIYYDVLVLFAGTIEKVTFEDCDGLAIFQEDIILGRTEDILKASEHLTALEKTVLPLGSCFIQEKPWDRKTVPYEINKDVHNSKIIRDAISEFNSLLTPLKFSPKTKGDLDYVEFIAGDGCSSYVGKQGGKQEITLSKSALKGNVLHEMLHSLGICHEHSRPDRDKFVTIDFKNIPEIKKHNFNRLSVTKGRVYDEYDYESIMHYSAYAFAIIKTSPTIKPISGEHPEMGQRVKMTAKDIAGIKDLYKLD